MHHSHLLSSLKANKCVLCVPRMLKGKVWEAAVKATVLIVIWQNGDLPLSPSATENGEESRKCETVPVFPDPTMFSSNFHHHPLTTISSLLSNWRSLQLLYGWVYGAMQWAEKWSSVSLLPKGRPALFYIPTTTKQQKKAGGEAFFGQSNFCKRHKEDKGNSSVSVYPDVPCRGLYLPFFVLLCSKLPEKLSTNPFLFSFWTPK